MKRRPLLLSFPAAVGGLFTASLPGPALAQRAGPVEGRDFVRLATPAAVADASRIEVVEFFWYACPHCNEFDPHLTAWVRKLDPSKVAFRRVHVDSNALQALHQQLFCTLEALGVDDEMHGRVFKRFHLERQPMNKADEAVDWAVGLGLDRERFRTAWSSFAVQTRMKKADAVVAAYAVDGVPTMGIHGRFTTTPSLTGGHLQTLAVTDQLIELARRRV
jgi:thiol:disulfide interchange protein DsbA